MPSIIDLIKNNGDLEEIIESLDSNQDQCTVKIDGEFPLLIASQHGRLDVVKLLVANDYVNDIQECFEIACFAYARKIPSLYRGACMDVAFFLLEIMEELDLMSQYGASLLFIPAQTANFEIFEFLISRIENINLPNNEYQPLMAAVIGRDPKIVALLLDAGANITLQKCGYTPLTMAYKMQKENGWEIDSFSEQIITLLEAESSRMYEASLEVSSQDIGLIGDDEVSVQ
jgi:ankyrin repeat protein